MNAKKLLNNCIVGLGLALGAVGAQAATISLVPLSGPVASGGQETFNVVANFGTVAIIGGGTDFSWNSSVLTFQSFVFGPALASPVRDTGLDVNQLQNPGLFSLGFGNLSGITMASDTIVGTMTFNAVGAPGSSTAINLTDGSGGYFDVTGNIQIAVDYTGATATITNIAAVPLPATGWLMLSGLGGLFGLMRRRA